jgi:hypothetical protein
LDYQTAEEMARALVKECSSALYIRSLVLKQFGESPSVNRIAALRSHHVTVNEKGRRTTHNARQIPSDFATVAPTMTKAELARHYNVLWSGTIDRWLEETGSYARKFVPVKNRLSRMGKVAHRQFEATRHKSECEEAADVLRRERFPVNRCNMDGSFNANGKFWRVGRNILDTQEMMEKAQKYVRV